jgi:ribosomal protein L40E
MAKPRPCTTVTVPPDGLYRAYCNRCGFSREAHERWDEWEWGPAAGAATPIDDWQCEECGARWPVEWNQCQRCGNRTRIRATQETDHG